MHTAPLPEDERTRRDGVPVTSPGRTIRDAAERYGAREAAEAARRALASGIITRERLHRELMMSSPGRAVQGLLDGA